MKIHSTKAGRSLRSCVRHEFEDPQGADFVAEKLAEETDSGQDMGNFRAKSVLFGLGMEALSSSVDEALVLREKAKDGTLKATKFRDLTRLFRPRLEFEDNGRGELEVTANTTGDSVESARTIILPKSSALTKTKMGKTFLRIKDGEDHKWVPKSAFSETDEAYYLPTYSDSPVSAAIGGGAKTLLTFGPIPALSSSVSGYAAHKFGHKNPVKFAVGAGVGAALFVATNALFKGPLTAGGSLLLGASAGLLGVHAGEGKASVRDAAYSGGLATFGVLPLSQDPTIGLHSAAAAGLGARAESPEAKVFISGAAGACLGAAHAALTGQSAGLMAALSAVTAVAGTLAGPAVMQASRNISHSSGEVLGKLLQKAPDPVLKVVGTVPFAAGMGFLGGAAGLVVPGAGAIGAIFGTLGGVALGHSKTESKIEAAAKTPPEPGQ